MLSELLQKASLFSFLHRIDLDLAKEIQIKGCPFCGSLLHQSNYERKPRGGPANIPDEFLIRQSLCCADPECRRRTKPPSSLFMGRRVYWGCVILVVMTLRQGRLRGASIAKMERLFSISRQTIKRWIAWFRDEFPQSAQWHRLRGRVIWRFPKNFPKSSMLFNAHRAYPHRQNGIIIVECPWAAMRFVQAGIKNVVALLGTSLSALQIQWIIAAPAVLLLLDADPAGRKAAAQIASILNNHTKTILHQLPDGLEPEDLSDDQLRSIASQYSFF